MAVEFKSSMSKNELLEIAAEHGIEADEIGRASCRERV